MNEQVICQECGWEGCWDDVWVDYPSGAMGPDPEREYGTDGPYYCPECQEEALAEVPA